MIIWLASYPKNGNTWLRSLISAYYYTKDGLFVNDQQLNFIPQFPVKKNFDEFKYNLTIPGETAKFWIPAQEKINSDRTIKFLKTHNALVKIGKNNFTDKKNTLGCIYIVRDPRNVLNSISRHFQLDNESALNMMIDKNNYTYDFKKKDDFSDYQFTSSWENNYKSWKDNSLIPVMFIRYEDLIKETFFVFKEIIKFINKISNNKKGFNREKARNAVKTTSFENLQKLEQLKGFRESIISREKKQNIPFFHLGPKSDWKKNFDKKFTDKINQIFEKNLIELNYK